MLQILGNDSRQPETIGTRDSPRARRALRRRPWTLSPERTGTQSRYVENMEKKTARSLGIIRFANYASYRLLTPSTSESESNCDIFTGHKKISKMMELTDSLQCWQDSCEPDNRSQERERCPQGPHRRGLSRRPPEG